MFTLYTLTLMTPTSSLPQLWHAHSNNSDIVTPTPTLTCSLSPWICSLTQLWHIHFPTSDMLALTALTCSLSPLTMWPRWEQPASSGMHTLISDNLASLVAVECSLSPLWQSGFTGSKLLAVDLVSLVAVDLASLVAVDLASLGASW